MTKSSVDPCNLDQFQLTCELPLPVVHGAPLPPPPPPPGPRRHARHVLRVLLQQDVSAILTLNTTILETFHHFKETYKGEIKADENHTKLSTVIFSMFENTPWSADTVATVFIQ